VNKTKKFFNPLLSGNFFRIVLPAILTALLFAVTIFFIVLPTMESQLKNQKREMISELTNSVWSLLSEYDRNVKNGILPLKVAQKRAAKRIREMRYGPENKDYFWINDMSPKMIMHPYRRDLEGKDVSGFADPKGKHLFVEFVKVVQKNGAGYVDYMWQWKDDPERIVPKISYVKGFNPWGWIIGTGIYVEDVRRDIIAVLEKLLWASGGIVFIVLLLSTYIVIQGFRVEQRRLTAENALRESEERYALSQRLAELGTWDWDVENNKVHWSDGAEKILGYPEGTLGTSSRTFRALVHPADLKKVLKSIKDCLRTGRELSVEYRVIWEDGSVHWISALGNAIRNDNGNASRMLGVVRDITGQKQAEEEKTSLEQQLKHAETMETVGVLAGGVAHDLNNILGAIVGYPDLILDDLPRDSSLRPAITAIKDSGERAAAVVQDLLALARRGIQEKEIVNLNLIIKNYLESREHLELKEKYPRVKIETVLDDNLLNIIGSVVHLSKILTNLVLNAVQAIPEEGIIRISTENRYLDKPVKGYDHVREGDYAVLTVEDSGIGISPEDRKKIFEPFYTKKIMGRNGTGLGMAVVWGSVKDQNGYIDVESQKNRGTRFYLYFPVTRKERRDTETEFSIEEYSGNAETILVVDDVEAQREIASALLRRLNYHVCTAASGEEAVQMAGGTKPDLIILDMIMDPGMDGFETYKKILEIRPGQKAIIASGYSETTQVQNARQLGAGTYIRKPYTLEKIGAAVKTELMR